MTNKCARAPRRRSTCTLVDFCADANSHYCPSSHLYSFTSLRISGQCIGDDVYIEDHYVRSLRIFDVAIDRPARKSTLEEGQRISGCRRMASTAAIDPVAIEGQSSLTIKPAENTAGALSRPHVPCTTLETPPSAQPTSQQCLDIIATIRPDHSDQSDQVPHATATIPGAVSCVRWNCRVVASLSCFERSPRTTS